MTPDKAQFIAKVDILTTQTREYFESKTHDELSMIGYKWAQRFKDTTPRDEWFMLTLAFIKLSEMQLQASDQSRGTS